MWLWSVFLVTGLLGSGIWAHGPRTHGKSLWLEGRKGRRKWQSWQGARPGDRHLGRVGRRAKAAGSGECPLARVAGPGLRLPTPASRLWFRQAAVPISFPHLKCARVQQAASPGPSYLLSAVSEDLCARVSKVAFEPAEFPFRPNLGKTLAFPVFLDLSFLFLKDSFSSTNLFTFPCSDFSTLYLIYT